MLRIIFSFLSVSGFILIFGGVGIIEASTHVFAMLIGIAVCMIGIMSFGVFAVASHIHNTKQYRKGIDF